MRSSSVRFARRCFGGWEGGGWVVWLERVVYEEEERLWVV